MNNATLINQSSRITDYRTPLHIVEAARKVMGSIELDPASSEGANKAIRAWNIYCEPQLYQFSELDGLPLMERRDNGAFDVAWNVRTAWMNPPFGIPECACRNGCSKKVCKKRGFHIRFYWEGNRDWVDRLVIAYEEGRVKQACCITFASTSEGWFQPLLRYPQAFLAPRTNYLLPNGEVLPGVTKGSVVTYLGPRVKKFAACFSKMGVVKIVV